MGQALTNEAVSQVKWIDLKAKIDAVDVLFVFGVGDGSVYRSLSSWLKKEEQRYLVFIEEQEEVFLKAKEMPLAKDPKARLFYWKKGDEEIFQQISWEFVFLRFGYSVSEPRHVETAHAFFMQLEHYHRGVDLLASDCEDMGLKVLTNAFKNLQMLPQSRLGQSLEGKCAGIPAIVCGAGPSLNAAMPLLAELKDKALIIAGGSAVRALNAQGIEPHICAAVDPQPSQSRFLALPQGVRRRCTNQQLLAAPPTMRRYNASTYEPLYRRSFRAWKQNLGCMSNARAWRYSLRLYSTLLLRR